MVAASAARRSSSCVAPCATCACMRMPAIGVRSSCAASAVKRRSLASCSCTRSNRPLSARTSGRTSGSTPSSGSGSSVCGWRAATLAPRARSGRTARRTAHQMPAASSGSATSNGSSEPRRLASSTWRRAEACSPTWMTSSTLSLSSRATVNTRQRAPPMRWSDRPRVAAGAIGASGASAERACSLPLCQIWNATRDWYLCSSVGASTTASSSSSTSPVASSAAVCARWASSSSFSSCWVTNHATATVPSQVTSTKPSTIAVRRWASDQVRRAVPFISKDQSVAHRRQPMIHQQPTGRGAGHTRAPAQGLGPPAGCAPLPAKREKGAAAQAAQGDDHHFLAT